jgi:hypothetical protein
MTAQLAGRELDEAVSRSMGMTKVRVKGRHGPLINLWRDLNCETALFNSDRHRLDCTRSGATLNEAIARLVAAVAEVQP